MTTQIKIVIAKLFLAALFAALMVWLVGCSVAIPIGERGKYGAVEFSADYKPPTLHTVLRERFPHIIAEQPNIGGYKK
jgi:hypothetical protein